MLPDIASYERVPHRVHAAVDGGRRRSCGPSTSSRWSCSRSLVAALAWFLNRTKHRRGGAGGGRQPRRRPAGGHQRQAGVDDRVGAGRRAGGGGDDPRRPAGGRQRRPAPVDLGPGDPAAHASPRPSSPAWRRCRSPWSPAVGIGVVEAVLFYNNPTDPGLIDAVLLVVVLRRRCWSCRCASAGLGVRERFSFAPRVRPGPAGAAASYWWVRHHTRIGGGAGARLAAIVLPLVVTSPSRQFLYARRPAHGARRPVAHRAHRLGGAAVARPVRVRRPRRHDHLRPGAEPAGLPGGGAARRGGHRRWPRWSWAPRRCGCAACSSPSARWPWPWPRRGSCPGRSSSTRRRVRPLLRRPVVGGVDLAPQRTYYYVCLAVLALAIVVVARVRRSGLGRSLLAVRDNELAAAAMGLSPTRVKLFAFARVRARSPGWPAGCSSGCSCSSPPTGFQATESLTRRGHRRGRRAGLDHRHRARQPVRSSACPRFFPDSPEVALLTSGVGLLVLLLYFPGGLVQLLYSARDAGVRRRWPAACPTAEPAAAADRCPARADAAPRPRLPARPPAPATASRSRPAGRRTCRCASASARSSTPSSLEVRPGRGRRPDRRQRRRQVDADERRRRVRAQRPATIEVLGHDGQRPAPPTAGPRSGSAARSRTPPCSPT